MGCSLPCEEPVLSPLHVHLNVLDLKMCLFFGFSFEPVRTSAQFPL